MREIDLSHGKHGVDVVRDGPKDFVLVYNVLLFAWLSRKVDESALDASMEVEGLKIARPAKTSGVCMKVMVIVLSAVTSRSLGGPLETFGDTARDGVESSILGTFLCGTCVSPIIGWQLLFPLFDIIFLILYK